jgi:hypothetical protein
MGIRLLVKGNKSEARAAAAAHGIPFRIVKEQRILRQRGRILRHPKTVGVVPCESGLMVRRWFGETGRLIPGVGYEPGTLLFFKERC